MKIAFTHNLKLTEAEEEAEFDTVETVQAPMVPKDEAVASEPADAELWRDRQRPLHEGMNPAEIGICAGRAGRVGHTLHTQWTAFTLTSPF